jgi:hypothetical protein
VVLADRPDTMIENENDKICLLFDVGISSERNAILKELKRK